MNSLCVANIGSKGIRRRYISGILFLIIGLAGAFILTSTDEIDRWWRILLSIPFYLGSIGIFQARGKT